MERLLRNATTVRVEVKPGKKFVRVRDSTWGRFGIQARARANTHGDSFHEVEKLPPADLSLFVRPQKQRLPFTSAPMIFSLPAAFRRAPVQCRILSIKILDLLLANKSKLVVKDGPCFIV